jgi:hypothetical protein
MVRRVAAWSGVREMRRTDVRAKKRWTHETHERHERRRSWGLVMGGGGDERENPIFNYRETEARRNVEENQGRWPTEHTEDTEKI